MYSFSPLTTCFPQLFNGSSVSPTFYLLARGASLLNLDAFAHSSLLRPNCPPRWDFPQASPASSTPVAAFSYLCAFRASKCLVQYPFCYRPSFIGWETGLVFEMREDFWFEVSGFCWEVTEWAEALYFRVFGMWFTILVLWRIEFWLIWAVSVFNLSCLKMFPWANMTFLKKKSTDVID